MLTRIPLAPHVPEPHPAPTPPPDPHHVNALTAFASPLVILALIGAVVLGWEACIRYHQWKFDVEWRWGRFRGALDYYMVMLGYVCTAVLILVGAALMAGWRP